MLRETEYDPQIGAKLIWCTTTPVPNDNKGPYGHRRGGEREFNPAAMEVMRGSVEDRDYYNKDFHVGGTTRACSSRRTAGSRRADRLHRARIEEDTTMSNS
mgnify:CR=1 FL=1